MIHKLFSTEATIIRIFPEYKLKIKRIAINNIAQATRERKVIKENN